MPISENLKSNTLCLPHHYHHSQIIPMLLFITNWYLLEISSLLKLQIKSIAWLMCTSNKISKLHLQVSEHSFLLFHENACHMNLTLFETCHLMNILLLSE